MSHEDRMIADIFKGMLQNAAPSYLLARLSTAILASMDGVMDRDREDMKRAAYRIQLLSDSLSETGD